LNEFILSIDIGAGSMRAGALKPDGTVFAIAVAPLAVDEPEPGWAEIEPELWWQALATVVGRVMRKVPRSGRVLGISLAGLTRTQVLLDRDGNPLAPAILFRDRRAADEAEAIARHFPSGNPAEAVSVFHPLARLAWVAQRRPALFARLERVLEPKDYLNFRLTGVAAADSITASRLDALGPRRRGLPAWVERCLELLELRRVAPWEQLGRVTAGEAPFERLAGVPVFAGAMDAWATAVGSGAIAPGQAFDIAGTSEVVGVLTRARVSVRGLVSLRWSEGAYQIGGPTQAGADCAQWCHAAFRLRGRMAQAVERVGKRLPSADRPIFLPYLAGERTPVWRADARGAFHNLGRTSGPDDFLWAVMEGVAMAARDIVETAVDGSGETVAELRVSGGGARSDAWCQMKADVLGLPVLRAAEQETGVTGAAIAASVGLGLYASLSDATAAMVRVGRQFLPRAPVAAFFDERARLYRRVKQAALDLADARATPPVGSMRGTDRNAGDRLLP
jgi:xylulokinase